MMTTLTTDQARRHFIHQLKVTPEKYHITGEYIRYNQNEEVCACAMGLMYLTFGCFDTVEATDYEEKKIYVANDEWETDIKVMGADPYHDNNVRRIGAHIIKMNDDCGRSFKFIARWLEIVWGIRD